MRITGNQSVAPEKLELARKLRREMTPQERLLWEALRKNQLDGLHFRRQQVIAGFIVDFYCASARLAVEVDGPPHLATLEYDLKRDQALRELGITTLRVSNSAVASDASKVLRGIAKEAERLRRPNP